MTETERGTTIRLQDEEGVIVETAERRTRAGSSPSNEGGESYHGHEHVSMSGGAVSGASGDAEDNVEETGTGTRVLEELRAEGTATSSRGGHKATTGGEPVERESKEREGEILSLVASGVRRGRER